MIKVGVDNLIISKDKKILLIRRSKEAKTYPLCWGFIGGWMEDNELPIQSLMRESLEEIGVETQDHSFLGKVFSNIVSDKGFTRIVLPHLATVPADAVFKLQEEEVCECKWFPFEEALSLDWAYDHLDIFKYALDSGKLDEYLKNI